MPIDSRDITAVYADSGHIIGVRQAAYAPQFLSVPFVLPQDQALISHTGTTSSTFLTGLDLTLPPELLRRGSRFEYLIEIDTTNSANNKTIEFFIDGVVYFTSVRTTTSAEQYILSGHRMPGSHGWSLQVRSQSGVGGATRYAGYTDGSPMTLRLRATLAVAAELIQVWGRRCLIMAAE